LKGKKKGKKTASPHHLARKKGETKGFNILFRLRKMKEKRKGGEVHAAASLLTKAIGRKRKKKKRAYGFSAPKEDG